MFFKGNGGKDTILWTVGEPYEIVDVRNSYVKIRCNRFDFPMDIDLISDYFQTEQEIRKIKIKKISRKN